MNAVNLDLAWRLEEALLAAGDRSDASVVLIRGAGGNFCAGGDFEEVGRLRADGPQALETLFSAFGRACDAVATIPQPVVAAVEGAAMAGGFELMQACDVVLVREDARIGDHHINFGMVPGGGGSQRLPRLVTRQRALGLLLSGDRLSGTEAAAWGLAYRAIPAANFDAAVDAFVATMATRRADALATIKRLVRGGAETSLEHGLRAEIDAVVAHICGDAGAASLAAFAGRKES